MKQIYLFAASFGFVLTMLGISNLEIIKVDSTAYLKSRPENAIKQPNPPKKYRPLVLKADDSNTDYVGATKNWLDESVFLPTITISKSVVVQGGGNATLGGILNYSILLSNTASGPANDAAGVVFTDQLINDLTLVAGSVKATPIAGDDAYSSIGNVGINVPAASGLLANDNSPTNEPITVTAVNTAGTSGTVTFNPNGSFTFVPNPGFSGNTTFSYTATGSTSSLTGTGTVTITVTSPIWFVDIAATSSTNVGTLANPFKNWSDFATSNALSGATNPAANQTIFVYSGTYTGAATLKSGQKVLGAGATVSLASFASITVPAHSSPALPSTNGTKPNLTSAGTTITLGTNNTLRGFDMGNSVKDIVGTSFTTLTASEMALNGDGQALDLSTGSLTCTFTSISSNNSADKGISFSAINGTLTSTGGTTITNPAAQGIYMILNSSVNANYGNTSVTGSGNIGVQLASAGSPTPTPTTTFGSLIITPDAGQQALVSNSNNGTITCTGGNITNRISLAGASTASKLNLNIELTSHTSDGNLQLTNTTGSFRINGTGTSGSGGSISGITTAPSISLNNASNVSINYFNITNSSKSCFSATNLSGICAINNCTFTMGTGSSSAVGNDRRCVNIINQDVALTLNVNNSTFNGNLTTSPDNNHGIAYESTTDANSSTIGTLNIKNSTFNRFNNYAVYTTSTGSAITDVGIQGSSVNYDGGTTYVGGAFHLYNLRSAKTTFNILNNTSLLTKGGLPIEFYSNNFDGSDFTPASGRGMEGKFNGNILTRQSTDAGTAVNILVRGKSNGVVQVNGNTITKGNLTLQAAENNPSAATETARLDATVTNNIIEELLSNYGIDVLSGNGNTPVDINGNGTFSNVINCVKISGNTINPIDVNGLGLIRFRTEGVSGGNASRIWREGTNGVGESSSTTYWNGNSNTPNSPGSSPLSTRVRDSGFGVLEFRAGGTCLTPNNAAPSALIAEPGKATLASIESSKILDDIAMSESNLRIDKQSSSEEATVVEKKVNVNDSDNTQKSLTGIEAGETVTVNGAGSGFLLPAGKSTTITFSATISNSPSTCAITNTASVSGSNFSTVNSNTTTSNIVIPPPTAVTTATSICTGQSISLSATCSSGTVQWYTVAAASTLLGTSASGATFSQSPTTNTTYQAACKVNGCESARTNSGLITVNPLPTISVSASPAICAGATSFTIPYTATTGTPTTYSISGTGITTVTNASLPATPITVNISDVGGATGGSYSYTLTVKNANDCVSGNVTGSVTVNPIPTITTGASTSICTGAMSFTIPYTATTGSPTTYSISGTGITTVNNGTLTSSPITVNLSSGASGSSISYILTVRNAGGCTSSNVNGSVTVNPIPTLTASASPAICAGATSFTIPYTATTGTPTTYSISGTGITTVTDAALPATPITVSLSSGASGSSISYNLIVKNANGCTSSNITGNVTVNALPTLTKSASPAICARATSFTIPYTGTTGTPTTYSISGTGITSVTDATLPASPITVNISDVGGATGSSYAYTLTVKNASGCSSSNITGNVTVNSTAAPTSPTATPSSRTTTGSSTLSATGCVGGTITWYNAADNVAVPSPNNQPNFTAQGTYNFYAKCAGANTCVSDASMNVSVSVNLCTPLASSPGNVGINWTGLISTDWNNPCNWNPAWVPDATNSAVVIDLKTNQPTISGTVPSVKVIYVNSGATLTVASGGTLNASSTTAVLTLQGGNLINDGTINLSGGGTSVGLAIGATASITNRGTITTNNLYGASLQFGNLTFTNESTGIFNGDFKANNNTLTLTNRGTINYGVGTYALSLGSAGSSVINDGTISIAGGSGISNPSGSTITNNACGKILMTGGAGLYENGGTTTNAGLIQMLNTYDFTNTGTFSNNGVLKANTVSGITNNRMVITNACPIFTLAGSNNYTVSGIFTDAGATTSAGTYTSVGNKFTANNTIPTGTQTLYAQVTNGTCTFVVPFDFNNRKPTSVSVNNTNVCLGTSVTLSGTCPSGTTLTWYTTAIGGSNIGTGTNLSNSPTVSTTYYAACEDGTPPASNCVSGRVATNAISVVSPPVVSLFSQTNVSCNGGNNGSATVTASSGTAPYTYSWAPSGGTAATATGLSVGTYTVTVTDANGCQKTSTVIITQPTVVVASISAQTNVSCNGASTGSATVTASGGSPSYTYSWAPSGGTSATASGLAAGTYTVTVTDANSCQKTATVNITQPAAFIASISAQTNIACNGASTGSATVTASSGTAPYTYSWTPSGGTAATATGLTAGTYTVTVTDANSCQQTATVNITQPTVLVASISAQTNIICNGASTGSATVTASGGNPNYTYSWAPSGGTSATATGLAAGAYTVTVTDANSCQKTATVNITQPTALVASISAQTNVLCNGASTGSATVTASGGTLSYTYSWAPSGGTSATATGLAAGTYTITVTDANSCQQTATVSITQPTALVASISAQTNVLCNGASTGSATVTASGGSPFFTNSIAPLGGTATIATNVSPSYTYSWAPSGVKTATATDLVAGTYTVTVTDANSCQQTATVNITQPTALIASISSQTNVACNGASTGSATVTASGGSPSYTYSWAPLGGTAATASGLAAGSYTVTVTDANSCQKTATVIITQPTALVASISAQTNVGCNGANTGSASVTASGGTPSYTYSWTPAGGTAATATGLVAGTYTVTVTDANSCQQNATVNITQPAALVASISAQTNIICNGASTGSATVTASGGTPSYTYAWAPAGGTGAIATGLAAGTYTVTVTDANSCQKTATVNITQPVALVASISSQTNIACNGASTGSATVTALNGTAPYTYSWAPLGGTSATASGLAAGTYTVTVTDANSCQQTSTINITQPTALVASISSQTNVACNGASSGSATVTASGGSPSYTYSWAQSGGTASTATGLAAGTYTVTVTDANSCQKTATVTITQPTALVASISAQTNVLCNGAITGSATVTASGGTPNYTYSWAPTGGTAASATGLVAGIYTVTVTDANACQQTATVNITQPTALVASISAQTNVLCNGASTGSATVTASGGNPNYTYSWAPSGGTSATASGLAAGTYTVTVTDANSCQQTSTINITQPTALVVSISSQTNVACNGASSGSATVTASGGSPSYTYSWAPSGGTASTATGLAAGTYTVTVTDANSCQKTGTVIITQPTALVASISAQTNVGCNGANTGSATVTASGGTPSYTYSWAPAGGTAATATGLVAGTYTVTVTDANSCQQTATVNITQPSALLASISAQTNVLCSGASTGMATVTASGGSPTYTYSWAPSGGTSATASGLAVGTYTVSVTDANSCQQTSTVNITQPSALVAAISAQINITCDGPSTGSATVTASGGSPSYAYSWAPSGGTSAAATGLAAGTYTVTVTDANGCSATVSTVVTFTNNLQVTQHPQNVSICQGNNATFMVQASLPGVTYQWEVNTGSGFIPVVSSAVYSGQNSATLSLAFPQVGYNGYQYRCVVSINGCVATSATATLSMAGSAEALNIVNITPINGVYSQTAVAYTIALNKIEPSANVTFKSGNAIQLLPGFETRSGAVFTAKIESPCANNSTFNTNFDNLPKEIRK